MTETENVESIKEIAYILEPVLTGDNVPEKLDEIENLITSANASVYGHTEQIIKVITPATFMGKGKVAEVYEAIKDTGVNLVVFDGKLSPSQTINISDIMGGIKVVDRTTLILDIFALNAKTNEGKLQVELAQLKYLYPRLKGRGSALSRLGGGIGTRGPGESKLETDRRYIRRRIDNLEENLVNLKTQRDVQNDRRKKNSVKTVAIVGYTNTGKSTLLNAMTGSEVLVKNQLFATLDPTARKLNLNKCEVLLVDTVGFVKNIPTEIIEAFKSTLEFAVNADLILNICDATGNWETELSTTLSTLRSLNAKTPIITVFNKCENIENYDIYPKDAVFISAKYKKGLDVLAGKIETFFSEYYADYEITLPYEKLNDFLKLQKYFENYSADYKDDKVLVKINIKKINADKIKEFL